ncbi:hypothetical protein [Shewanella kaireitica]|uniref:hypothetical protein n=1 Tax=Shewanella kaireitica TaxID=212021 RepID=UPI00200F9EFE|nr:hypothetical protein [Shewanella kaireitica]MCL1095990.1 hypothetical protein [Shewanella kaireitica]
MQFDVINLNNKDFKVHDCGEGSNVIFIYHQQNSSVILKDLVTVKVSNNHRVITVDLSDDFPSDVAELSENMSAALVEDLHLLADVYGLEKVVIESNYLSANMGTNLSELLWYRFIHLITD